MSLDVTSIRPLRHLLDPRDEPGRLAVPLVLAHVPDLVEGLRVRLLRLADEAN